MLELKNVQKVYRTKAGVVNALDGVSLKFPSSGMVFISGKSGCGKTTLLNVIGGLDGIDGGEIYINDKNFSTFSAEEYDSYRNTLVGFVFQEYNLLSEYTVEYNIKIAMELQGVPVEEEAFEKLLKDIGNRRLAQPQTCRTFGWTASKGCYCPCSCETAPYYYGGRADGCA